MALPLEGTPPHPLTADAKQYLCQDPPCPLPKEALSRIRTVITTAADFSNP